MGLRKQMLPRQVFGDLHVPHRRVPGGSQGSSKHPLTLNSESGPEYSPKETPKTFLSWETRTCTEAAVV